MKKSEVKENVNKILNQFLQEEVGNRLSQFAVIALTNLILDVIDKLDESESLKDKDIVGQG